MAFQFEKWIKDRKKQNEPPITVTRIEDYSPEQQAYWATLTGHVEVKEKDIWTYGTKTTKGPQLRDKKGFS